MKKQTATADEVKHAFLSDDMERDLNDIEDKISSLIDYPTSTDILAKACEAVPQEDRDSMTPLDKMCFAVRYAYIIGYMQATKIVLQTNEYSFGELFGTDD